MKPIERKLRFAKKIALLAAFAILWQSFFPTISYALTGGPSQPEVNKPSVIGTSKMVDPFTGNLNYSIPLMKVGDYPLSLSYDAGVKMDQEASMVGLGWTLNPGVVKRNVRGLPDDFKGEEKITKKFNQKQRLKLGLGAGVDLEAFGLDMLKVGLNAGLFYDNYTGMGLEYSVAPSLSVAVGDKGKFSASLGLNVNSQKGASVSPQANMSFSQSKKFADHKYGKGTASGSVGLGTTFDSRQGFTSLSMQTSISAGLGDATLFNETSSVTHSFVDQSYSTKISHPRVSFNGSFSGTVGGELYGSLVGASISGYYSLNKLEKNKQDLPAFGYLYSHDKSRSNKAALDFTREKGGVFEASQPVMGIPSATYDIYNASGAGISGSYRPYRGDVGIAGDPYSQTKGGNEAQKAVGGIDISAEVGVGNMVHAGVNVKTNSASTTTDFWKNGNELFDNLSHVHPDDVQEAKYEPYYFKSSSEKQIVTNPDYYQKILWNKPVRGKLLSQEKRNLFKLDKRLLGKGDHNTISNPLYKKNRAQRNKTFQNLTALETQKVGLDRKIKSYELNHSPLIDAGVETIDRIGPGGRKEHHISQVAVTKEGGKRYVYGIPAYNTHKEEVSFNIAGNTGNCQSGLVQYNPGKDNTTNNDRGNNHSFDKTITPGYAHSYLLTAVLSDDYADLTGNGPSADDRGDFTRFNYTRVSDNYKWRVPYQKNAANYQKAQQSLENDDGASYVYGKKEIWYIHSIETKNHIAEFTYEDRKDGLGVQGENGGKSTAANQKQKKLVKITLYSKADRLENKDDAEPLKTAHFRYNYSLCQGIPNSENGKGKLTLQEVFFTYGKSEKGRFSPYQFNYSNFNPDYELKAVDRFGNYKANNCNAKSNNEFPYASQNEADIDKWVNAWKLKEIKLPSGGLIKVDYEPDDYAYVQDKRAMRMFQVEGFADNPNPSNPGNTLYDINLPAYTTNNYLFFKLEEPISTREELDEYFEGIEQLLIRAKVDVVGARYTGTKPSDTKEFVLAFSEIADYGFYERSGSGNAYSGAYIKLKPGVIEDVKKPVNIKEAQPLSKAAWQYSIINTPRYAYDNTSSQDKPGKQLLSAVKNLTDFVNLYLSYEIQMLSRQVAREVNSNKTMVRLNDPDKRKYGGDYRVKRVTIHDNWEKMTNQQEPGFSYGTEYSYTKKDGKGRTISSGVAAYEPKVGGEANALKKPKFFNHKGNTMFMLTPFGESFYPAPNVGYSKVTQTSLKRPNIDHPGSGYTVHKFYTARDFPIRTSRTRLDNQQEKPNFLQQLNPLKFRYQETRAITQGFLIEKNNMHGKQKSRLSYRENSQTPISGFRYHYKMKPDGTLNNQVKVIDKNGQIEDALRGVTVDFIADSRQQKSKTEIRGVNINADSFLAGIIPIVIPVPLPAQKIEKTMFRALATTKVITRQGILQKVESINHGGKQTEEKLAYDKASGQPILTRSTNIYGDNSYTYQIPAHHAYEGMEAAYQNIGLDIGQQNLSGGRINITDAGKYFRRGDRLLLTDPDEGQTNSKPMAWVYKTGANSITVINDVGEHPADDTYNVKIIASGYANKHKTIIGTVQTESNPLSQGKVDISNAGKILNATASTYKDRWQTYAGFKVEHKRYDCNCRFVKGNANLTSILNDHFTLKDTTYTVDLTQSQFQRSFLADQYSQKNEITLESSVIGNIWTLNMEPGENDACKLQLHLPEVASLPENGSFAGVTPKDLKPNQCNDIYGFTVDYRLNKEESDETGSVISLTGHSTCFKMKECSAQEIDPKYTCNLTTGEIVNPFQLGILGNWRKVRNYTYHTERRLTTAREGGTYAQFTAFDWNNPGKQNWIWDFSKTKIDPFGNAIEEKDVLDRYNNMIYGYSNTRVIASTQNARYHNSGFDGFEDYGYANRTSNTGECLPPGHFRFNKPGDIKSTGINVQQTWQKPNWIVEHAHTGKYSARVTIAQELTIKRSAGSAMQAAQNDPDHYRLQAQDLAGIFTPDPGKYVISAWVQDPLALQYNDALSFSSPSINIKAGGTTIGTVKPSGPIIDGWQRMEGVFTIPENAGTVTITLSVKQGLGAFAYFDDVRVHPFDAQMKSYVYDPQNLRLSAILDNNNFATLYQYDNQGSLVSKKKETERGILTIQESRFGAAKRP